MEVTKESILEALKLINRNPDLLKGRTSSTYDLIYENKKYPPILVLSEANKLNGGKELMLEDFGNSVTIPFEILKKHGFKIEKKVISYYEELNEFLIQSKTNDLKYSKYLKSFLDLDVKVSFGQGGAANIPWISFLRKGISTSNGIYPVYLYYKKENLLILAYGISETNQPEYNWPLENLNTIENYFKQNQIESPPFRYRNSFIYKVYNPNKLPEKDILNKDLIEFLNFYKSLNLESKMVSIKQELFDYKSFHKKTEEAGLIFSEKMVARFVASLCTKPFVICSGLSGSGKTKLAQAFVQWICESEQQYKIIPVGADWTNREPLLGYPNGLDDKKYVKPDSGVLDVIFKALENENKPYFLILDEMNLSHVERYFADFLSIMESKDKIKLHSGDTERGIPKDFEWPKNLFIIGTVNIDETTYMFSPKVLDRANVIEFRISEEDLQKYLESDKILDMNKFLSENKITGLGAKMSGAFLTLAKEDSKHTIDNKTILLSFFKELQKAGAEFGYRSTFEINRLIALLNNISKEDNTWNGKSIDENEFIDIAIMQKLLPKLHGSRNKLTRVLPILGGFCVNESKKVKEDYLDKIDEIDFKADDAIIYKLSFEKICRMYKNAIENGYASYAEA